MNKLNLFLLVGASLVTVANAAPRTQQQARAIAQQMAVSQGHSLVAQSITPMPGNQNQQPYYVFNVEQGGFVIISGEDRMTALVGYADSGSFDAEQMPDGLRYYLDQYAARVASVSVSSTLYAIPTDIDYPTIEPLLGETQWDQGNPYNLLCPLHPFESTDDDGQTVVKYYSTYTGCAATAAAQIMSFHQFPVDRVAIPGYVTESFHIQVDAIDPQGTQFDWAHMLPVYGKQATETEQMAVARLMADVGAAMQMDYTAYGSGAPTDRIVDCLTLMGYDTSLLQVVFRRDFTQRHWFEVINNELRHNRPIEYMGAAGTSGHAFVLDGCDGQGYYHINWGWSGNGNGCFDLAVLNPYNNSGAGASQSTDGYHVFNQMVIGITPANVDGEEPVVPDYADLPDYSLIDVDADMVDPDNNFYYCRSYQYQNPIRLDITNNTAREMNDFVIVGTFDTLAQQYLSMLNYVGFDLKPGETVTTIADLAATNEVPATTALYFDFNVDAEPFGYSFPNIVEVEAPQLYFNIEGNASYAEGDENVICADEAVIKLTVTNTGGRYRGRDFIIDFLSGNLQPSTFDFPEGTSELTFSLPVEPGYSDTFIIYTENGGLEASSNYQDNLFIGGYSFVVADDVTGIEKIASAEDRPTTNRRYNLQGQPVGPDYRGMIIKR